MSYLKKPVGKAICLVLLAATLLTLVTVTAFAKNKASLSKTKLSLKAGKSYTLKVKGYSGKVKWSVSGKKLVSIKASGKKRLKAVIKAGKKTGTCYVIAKAGKKTLKCKVTVKSGSTFKERPISSSSKDLTSGFTLKQVEGKAADDAFITATTNTSLDLLKFLVANEDSGKNILISPDSILTAMVMTENGASGNTLSQMENAFGGISIKDHNEYLYTLNKSLTDDKKIKYHIANSIWYRDSEDFSLEVKKDFIQNNIDHFNASIYQAPFSDATIKDVNNWVYNNTHGMIPSILDRLEEEHVMVLLNALSFEGDWESPYDDTHKEPFMNEDGTVQKKVNMLNGTEHVFVEVGKGTGFVKYYKGRKVAFMGLMTPEGMTVDQYLASLTGSDFVEGYKDRKSSDVTVTTKMPEFKYDYGASLVDAMKSLGITDAFDGYAADFSGISDYPLNISDVIHKTHIDVTKDGTKAAAVTGVVMEKAGEMPPEQEPEEVILDHPFIYSLIDTDTGIPLFIGVLKTV